MAELLVRVGALDASFLERNLPDPRAPHPTRIVVDAHVPVTTDRIRTAARTAGIPYLIDPQTYYMQDVQDPSHPWPRLPFADPAILTPADILRPGAADTLAETTIDHQVAYGATALIAPYVHIARGDDGWLAVQAALWKATRAYIDRSGLRLPVVAAIAVGWRLLERRSWPVALQPLGEAVRELGPTEVALAASKVDAGAHPEERVASLVASIGWISRSYPVIAWQQGVLGEVAVLAGGIGYECGIGWRERCDLPGAMARLRKPRAGGGSARPVYSSQLRRSLPRKTIEYLVSQPRPAAELTCSDPSCCPNGRNDLLGDARGHGIRTRLVTLQEATAPDQPPWRWHRLAQSAHEGIQLAERLNTHIMRTTGVSKVPLEALRATAAVADHQCHMLNRSRAA